MSAVRHLALMRMSFNRRNINMVTFTMYQLAEAFVEAANESDEINLEYKSIHKLLRSGMSIYDIVTEYDLAYNMSDLLSDGYYDEESVLEAIKSYNNDDLADCIKEYL